MGKYVRTTELFDTLLPRGCQSGVLAMLTAYFDDSGTHGNSDIVVVAGLVGTEARLGCLERNWRRLIDNPLDGARPALSRFHAYDCNASQNEFAGWSRTETDYFTHQLRTAIIESEVAGYGMVIPRGAWDDLVTGEMRAIFGSAEGNCIRSCFVNASGWAQVNCFDPQMTFVFDNRPSSVQADAQIVFQAFQQWVQPPPKLVGIAFLSSVLIAQLQAADLIAWELYQHAVDVFNRGIGLPRRQGLNHLTKNMDFKAQMAQPHTIAQMIEMCRKQGPEKVRQMADHFNRVAPAASFERQRA